MATSVFLAQLIGPVAVVTALSLLLDRAGMRSMAQEFLQSPALIFLSGMLTMTAGVAVVLHHNVWVADWRVLPTLFGWAAAIGGAVRIGFPGRTLALGEAMLAREGAMTAGGLVWLATGLVLCFFGYIG